MRLNFLSVIMAAMVASDQPLDSLMPIARAAFADKPTGDFDLLPLISLIRGRRMRRILQVALGQIFGHPADIKDTWTNYFCVAGNYTEAREQVISFGPLTQSLLASTAIPGAFPPVPVAGDLLFDGGTFNNVPVSIMRKRRGAGKVIGMDLGVRRPKPVAFDEVPGTWALLRDRLRARQQRRYKLPSFMAYRLNVNIMYSNSRQGESRRLTDCTSARRWSAWACCSGSALTASPGRATFTPARCSMPCPKSNSSRFGLVPEACSLLPPILFAPALELIDGDPASPTSARARQA